jgi:hypothetical protein
MKRETERQRFKATQRKLKKWLRKATVQNVCPVCGADVRDNCECQEMTDLELEYN